MNEEQELIETPTEETQEVEVEEGAQVEAEVETEPEETIESLKAKVAELEEQKEIAFKKAAKESRRVQKKHAEAMAAKEQLEHLRNEMAQYTGQQYEQPTQKQETQTPSVEEIQQQAVFVAKLNELGQSNPEIVQQVHALQTAGINPTNENPAFAKMLQRMPNAVELIPDLVADRKVCAALSFADDEQQTMQIFYQFLAGRDLKKQQTKPPVKPVSAPPAKPKGNAGTPVNPKDMTPEQYHKYRLNCYKLQEYSKWLIQFLPPI